MTDRAAISGCFADYRLVKSRSVLQLVVEVPVERQEEAFAALGYPVPGAEIHVALARLVAFPASPEAPAAPSARSEQGRARYAASTERQQAVVRAAQYPKDKRFREWMAWNGGLGSEEDTIKRIREECDVKSRAELLTNDQAYTAFLHMEGQYREWAGMMPEMRS